MIQKLTMPLAKDTELTGELDCIKNTKFIKILNPLCFAATQLNGGAMVKILKAFNSQVTNKRTERQKKLNNKIEERIC